MLNLTADQIIDTICPALAGSPSKPVYVAMAVETTNRRFFGKLYNEAIAYKACHLFTLFAGAEQGGSVGGGGIAGDITSPVKAVSEGGLRIEYSVAGESGGTVDDMKNTKYGLHFLSLARSIPRLNVNRGGVCGGIAI
jgi:hypothetical protein